MCWKNIKLLKCCAENCKLEQLSKACLDKQEIPEYFRDSVFYPICIALFCREVWHRFNISYFSGSMGKLSNFSKLFFLLRFELLFLSDEVVIEKCSVINYLCWEEKGWKVEKDARTMKRRLPAVSHTLFGGKVLLHWQWNVVEILFVWS